MPIALAAFFNALLSWLLSAGVMRVMQLLVGYVFLNGLVGWVTDTFLNALMNTTTLGPSLKYGVYVTGADIMINMIMTAIVIRFIIRRLPR